MHRHSYHHVSNRSMRKCQMKRRIEEHTKTPSWFTNTKVYSLLHFSVLVGNKLSEKWVDCFCQIERNKILWKVRGQTLTLILTSSFSAVVLARACSLFSSSRICSGFQILFPELIQNGRRNFRSSEHRCNGCTTVVFTSSRLVS